MNVNDGILQDGKGRVCPDCGKVNRLGVRFCRHCGEFLVSAEQAKQEVRDRVARHDIPCDLQDGQLIGVHKRGYLGWAQELADALTERYAYPFCRALSAEETREYVATDDFLEGLYDPEAMTLHPLNYTLGIANAASDAGVRLFENSRVLSYSKTDPALVRTAQGSVKASHIVLACNGYLGNLEPRSAGKIMPINNFMVATQPLGEERALELINGRFGVHDTRFVVNYFRTSGDHRLLFGGGENYRAAFPRDIAAFVRPHMLQLFPQLRDARIDYAWGGTLAITLNRMPALGCVSPRVFYSHGYSGHGVPTATLAGKLIAEVDENDRVAVSCDAYPGEAIQATVTEVDRKHKKVMLSRRAHLEHVRKVKQAVSVPVIGSLNGFTHGGGVVVAEQHVITHRTILERADHAYVLDGQGRRLPQVAPE